MVRRISWTIAVTIVALLTVFTGDTAAKSKRGGVAALENAVAATPSAPGPWLALARFHDEHDQRAPAILCYARFLTLDSRSEEAKSAAARVWKFVVPNSDESSTISMRPPEGDNDPWWQTELLLVTQRSIRHRGKAEAMSDAEFFATSFEGLTLFIEDLGKDKHVSSFWRAIAIPYFLEAHEKGHIESMAYDMTRPVGRPETQKWIDANGDALAKYHTWSQQWKPGA